MQANVSGAHLPMQAIASHETDPFWPDHPLPRRFAPFPAGEMTPRRSNIHGNCGLTFEPSFPSPAAAQSADLGSQREYAHSQHQRLVTLDPASGQGQREPKRVLECFGKFRQPSRASAGIEFMGIGQMFYRTRSRISKLLKLLWSVQFGAFT